MNETLKYLSKTGVLHIHQRVLARYGGRSGVRSESLLASSIAQPLQQFDGKDLYPDLWTKAAAYAYFICRNHPFFDGNKRTAAATMEIFLRANGYELYAPVELAKVILKIAEGKLEIAELAQWIENKSKPTETNHA